MNDKTPQETSQLAAIPQGMFIGGNRYQTDDKEVLHIWNADGKSYDITEPRINPTQPPDKHQRSSEEVITVLADHWLKGHSLNLGQYKAQYQCACGEVLIEDGHAEDYRSSITQIHRRHVASAIEAIIARTNRESRIDELKQLLPGKKPVGEPILVTIHNRIAALESQQEASNERQCCKR